jgi:hypothetical protein
MDAPTNSVTLSESKLGQELGPTKLQYSFVCHDGTPCAAPNTPGGPKLTFAETTYLLLSKTPPEHIVCWGEEGSTILVRITTPPNSPRN